RKCNALIIILGWQRTAKQISVLVYTCNGYAGFPDIMLNRPFVQTIIGSISIGGCIHLCPKFSIDQKAEGEIFVAKAIGQTQGQRWHPPPQWDQFTLKRQSIRIIIYDISLI